MCEKNKESNAGDFPVEKIINALMSERQEPDQPVEANIPITTGEVIDKPVGNPPYTLRDEVISGEFVLRACADRRVTYVPTEARRRINHPGESLRVKLTLAYWRDH